MWLEDWQLAVHVRDFYRKLLRAKLQPVADLPHPELRPKPQDVVVVRQEQ